MPIFPSPVVPPLGKCLFSKPISQRHTTASQHSTTSNNQTTLLLYSPRIQVRPWLLHFPSLLSVPQCIGIACVCVRLSFGYTCRTAPFASLSGRVGSARGSGIVVALLFGWWGSYRGCIGTACTTYPFASTLPALTSSSRVLISCAFSYSRSNHVDRQHQRCVPSNRAKETGWNSASFGSSRTGPEGRAGQGQGHQVGVAAQARGGTPSQGRGRGSRSSPQD
mmetsp:Transcript_10530/g.24746  ORF Transcript_10530/g.24746 Transcript_10530/m.24746 type:complete len:222 (-) Transcript_10530:275-940(-)